MASSLQRRLLLHYFLIIVAAVIVLEIIYANGIRAYYHTAAEYALRQRALLAAYTHNASWRSNNPDRFLQNIDTSDTLQVEILDLSGKVLSQTSDPLPQRVEGEPDFEAARLGNIGVWKGRNYVTSERIMAVCVPIYNSNRITGVLRYTVSMERTHHIINTLTFYGLIVGCVIIAAAPGLFLPLIRRAIAPLEILNNTAEQIIDSEYPARLVKPTEAEFSRVAAIYNKMFDQIERNEKLQNDFISSITHELRTPLTAIKGWEETLSSGGLEDKEELALGLEIIGKETERMIGLVEDLLDFSQLQAGRISLILEKVSINELVGEIHDLLSVKAAKKSVALAMELGGNIPEMDGDGNRLKQVLLNLLDNALKFTPAGGSITIRTHRYGEVVEIDVIDTGPGIAAKDLPHVLSKFVKVDGRKPGSGLGLSIANEIVTLHGGQLLLSSEEGKGTKVTVRLPIGGVHQVSQR
ncbi:MAG: HAMP domain-containing histidine kinase [Firmicutes bacterium]|nr:HAMP domain-containing histidine kinase [Bacillota bacterium]